MTVFGRGQLLQQLEAELLALPYGGASVGFIDDDALGGDGEEVLAMPLAFDLVEADDDEGVLVKETHAGRQ